MTTRLVIGYRPWIALISRVLSLAIILAQAITSGFLPSIALAQDKPVTQCSDGIDNDGDGKIDALVTLSPGNGELLKWGFTADPGPQFASELAKIIVAKKLKLTPTGYVNGQASGILRTENGTVHAATAQAVCQVLGYKDYVDSTCDDGEKCNFFSTSDNYLWRYTNGDFKSEIASPKATKTWFASIQCKNRLAACNDGWDNDGDGKIDTADDGCANGDDDSEVAHDPACLTPSSTSETEQCRDGVDNDNDGVSDKNDPGCWANPKDPTSYDPNRTDESAATTQCQDGVDNDGDGAADFPADFSCASKTDYDETDPKSQCQDGLDNDSDGLTDLKDPDCANAQDNLEGGTKSQCQDGIDNDKDGVSDKDDPGCWKNPLDPATFDPSLNDESAATTKCQDGKDNDGDSLVDMKDPGCTGPTDNDEFNKVSQCTDKTDNDNDGLIDSLDPGCQDGTDDNEGDEPALLTVGLECVTTNVDNTKTAYLSYNNTTSGTLSVTTSADNVTLNEFVTSGSKTPPPTSFKPGIAKGSVAVTFSGDSLTWVVRAAKSALSQVAANSTSPKCGAVVPVAECRGFSGGVMKVRMGYNNPNAFEQQFALGALNLFTSGKSDRGQPNKFFTGLNKSAFEIALDKESEITAWSINGTKVAIDSKLPTCPGMCIDTPTGAISGNLNQVALDLSSLMNRAAALLASANATDSDTETVVSAQVARDRRDAERSKRKAIKYAETANSLTIQIPAVTKTCPEAPQYCVTVDRAPTIEGLKGLYANQRNSVIRTVTRAYWRNTGRVNRDDKLIRDAKALEQQGLAELGKLARFAVECK